MNMVPAQVDKTITHADMLAGRVRLVCRGGYYVLERVKGPVQQRLPLQLAGGTRQGGDR